MAINPFNYNIDYFDSVPFGPISDSDFLNQLLGHNLQNLDPSVANILGITTPNVAGRGQEYDVSLSTFNVVDVPDLINVSNTPSESNNFTQPLNNNLEKNPSVLELATWYPDYTTIFENESDTYKTLYGVPATLSLGFVGNVDNWVQNGVTVNSATELIENGKRENKYGPASLISYDTILEEVLVKSNTGLIQYNTGVQGDFRDEIFNRTLGVGVIPFSTIGSGINYKPDGQNISELDKIARERRGFEVKERLRINFLDSTIGSLNLNPLSLLTGNPPISFDISITRPANFAGRAAEFVANLAGFNIPISILQDYDFNFSIFNKDGTLDNRANPSNINEIDVTSGLLNRTGAVTRGFIFDNISNNKYGPNFDEEYETKNEGTYLNLLAEKPLDVGTTTTTEGGFYGKFEPGRQIDKAFSSKAQISQERAINDYISESGPEKPITTYEGTPSEVMLTANNYGTVNEKFDWRIRRSGNKFTRGILSYTQNLVNNSKLDDASGYIGYFDSIGKTGAINEFGLHQTGVDNIDLVPQRPSRGNTARNYNFETDSGGGSYCRSWSSRRKYHTWNNLIRSDRNWWRIDEKFSSNMTMNWGNDNVGIPKIAYEISDSVLLNAIQAGKKVQNAAIPYMFSIENLAWKDAPQFQSLPDCEKGPNGGRIMWFPPYGISFSENNSTNWESTSFIGRGENIYTYNNTERSGTLDFIVIVDHPEVLNKIKKDFSSEFLSDEPYHSFFAGCDINTLRNLVNKPTTQVSQNTQQQNVNTKTQPCSPSAPESDISNIKIYFENSRTASSDIGRKVDVTEYEVDRPNISPDGVAFNEWTTNGSLYQCGPASGKTYVYLNSGVNDKINKLAEFLLTEDGKNYKIKIRAYTSPDSPTSNYNKILAEDRAKNTKEFLYNLLKNEGDPPHINGDKTNPQYKPEKDLLNSPDRWDIKGEPNSNSQNLTGNVVYGNPCDSLNVNDPNSNESKKIRYSEITLEQNLKMQNDLLQTISNNEKKDAVENSQQERQELLQEFARNFITECEYFESMKREQPFVYTSLQEKIKYFHPAFHSMTPEGLNSRLTFLNQCTRQGPQLLNTETPQNMVFGRPPICVLRIGDFYNTKIVVESINITYDPLQWDLNPEGIGVQPMIAKVSMSFKFIGGSSLGGPISQLQNAVSYNFYANTGVYQPWKYVESAIDEKQKFIYGAFLSPEDAATAYGNVNSNLGRVQESANKENLQSVNTTTTPTETQQTNSVEIQENYNTLSTPQNENTNSNVSDDLFLISNTSGIYSGQITEKGNKKGYKIIYTGILITFNSPETFLETDPDSFSFRFTPDITNTDNLIKLKISEVLSFIESKKPSNPNDGFSVYLENLVGIPDQPETQKSYKTFFYRQTGSLDVVGNDSVGGS